MGLEIKEILNKELDKIDAAIKSQPEEIILVLQAHLFVENIIDEMLCSILKRGDILTENNLSFYQKLLIIQASDIIESYLIDTLKRLNNIRNKFSHQLQYNLSEKDIDFIGAPFGERYKKIKKSDSEYPKVRLRWIIYTLIAHLRIKVNNL
ncbi:hypothetical protein KKC83_06810 [Patescibacteria group bacterium]|nr:hypothetical protein [Candidatus Falkowbacteria bacterium]MBU3905829.1 hypothetical protein [Patescibacteria group bacterium]MBU4015172.1 hypothetical protein [Patescibacteria group bacterium]MBU4027224.1 hypothetical protein [Patescibacteria group bacterium]MBU4073403.1 hypothetical protein [Patescibacteria group bacterium]